MSATAKVEILEKVAASRAPIRRTLRQMGVPKSNYYRWRTRIRVPGHRTRGVPRNRLTEGQRQRVLTIARASPVGSSRQIAAWITDNDGFSVSESSVFRILKREGLVRRIEIPVPVSNEYRHKTTAPHQLWATDTSSFRVCRMGLLLHGDSDGRLLEVRPGLEALGRHDFRLTDRGGLGRR